MAAADETLQVLLANHRRFLRFLEPRVGSREAAEDILQAAFVKGLTRAEDLRDGESAVAWFYRLLRNALIDHHRRRAAEQRRLAVRAERAQEPAEDEALRETVCRCVEELIPHAGVRLHRARAALKKQLEATCGTCTAHGCLRCSCGQP